MRKQFVKTGLRSIAKSQCPWAIRIAKVVGSGYWCFENIEEYEEWMENQ